MLMEKSPEAQNERISDNQPDDIQTKDPKTRRDMSEHIATVDWKRETPDFAYENYNRDHDWSFDAGVTSRASANPAYLGNESCVDPEEVFVASLASCHMLTFLAIVARKRYVVDGYHDKAVGILAKTAAGSLAITRVTLMPEVRFGGAKVPSPEELRQLHDLAHHACFIANSVKTEVVVEPQER
jgi:organic hydroperoxide reductase OsmC/OhrA